jgi:hypothetical protein
MKVPKLKKEIAAIQEKNAMLAYQIECFESPDNLLALANQPNYSHLKYPCSEEILAAKVGIVAPAEETPAKALPDRAKALVFGARP